MRGRLAVLRVRQPMSIVIALAITSFVLALVVADQLFPFLSANNDEAVYLFQARIYRSGHLTLPADGYRDFFRPWMSSEHDQQLVLVFQPVFPALLALSDLMFGSMRMVLGLIAGGSVLLVYALARELGLPTRARVIACAFFALSPFAVIQSALYLEYLFAVALEMAVLTLLLAGLRSAAGRRARRLTAAGLLFGLLVFTRPLEGLMLGAAMGLYLIVRERTLARALRQLAWPLLGALPIVALMLVYNAQLTGNPLRFPLWAIGGNNSFGFGKRNVVDGSPLIDVTFVNGLKALHQNMRSLPHWVFGSILVVPLAFYGLWQRRREPTTVLLAAIGVLFPLAYLFYWGNLLIVNGRKMIGPHYYMALLIPTVVFAATALDRLAVRRKSLATLLFVSMIGATMIEMPDKIDRNDHFTEAYRAEQAAIDSVVDDRAVVILPITPDGVYLLHPRGWLTNDLGLRNPILYAADRGADNIELSRRFTDRRLYRLQAVEATQSPVTFRPSVREVVAVKAAALTRTIRAPVPAEFTKVNAYVQTNNENRQTCAIAPSGSTVRATVEMRAGGVELTGCTGGPIELRVPTTPATLVVGFEFLTGEPERSEFREVHIWTATDGSDIVSLNDETWRIVPHDKNALRVIEASPDLVVTS
ncbi:MAG TPA: hypothetical protein VM282_24630 [Acidimicrobiales bacterium]|nr:hypothetical protein [Acidimicrobiales bacterium]